MSEKTALVRALRSAFVEELSGMYDSAEMDTTNKSSTGFTDEDIQEFDVDTETSEVKEENVIDIEEL